MKVLLSAYACYPGYGSEPEVGLRVLESVASQHSIWVLTLPRNVEPVSRFLAGVGLDSNVRLIGFDPSRMTVEIAHTRGRGFVYWHYERWQRKARSLALKLDEEIGFDVAHHVTLANYWAGIGIKDIRKPLLVGPVGGGGRIPGTLLPLLGARGILGEGMRLSAQSILGKRFQSLANRPQTRILYQNQATMDLTDLAGTILPNATVVDLPLLTDVGPVASDVVVVGKLERWKGSALAVRAFQYVEHRKTRLVFLGEGPQQRRTERLAQRLGVQDRVVFVGRVSREEVLRRVATAGVMLHASLRDEASLAIAEALSLGTPVVALDYCASDLANMWPTESRLVNPSTVDSTAREMAHHIDSLLESPRNAPLAEPAPSVRSLTVGVLEEYEELCRAAPQ